MATWQADFHLVPAAETRRSSDRDDLIESWRKHEFPASYAEAISAFADPTKSWSPGLQVWGADDGDRIDVHTEGARVVNVFIRFDLRRPSQQFLTGVLKLANLADAVLLDSAGNLVAPTASEVAGALTRSSAAKFVKNPKRFLESIKRT